jgi:outer membrane protein assembly factor BamB
MNTAIPIRRTPDQRGFLLLLSSLLAVCNPCFADDWPQFRGPKRDGVSREINLLKAWSEGGPKRLWLSTNLGSGYSGPAIVGENIYIMGQRAAAQWLLCLEAKGGKELWATRLGDSYANEYGDGPRSTPTVRDDSVFALGANGELLCADSANGKERWRAKLTELGGKVPGWGYTESPLVDGARVVVTPGGEQGAVVALDLRTGQALWRSKDFTDEAQYTSLMTLEKGGVRQYISGNRERVAGLAADDGRLLWQEKFRSGVVVSQSPIVSGDQVYMVAAGGTGCKAVKLTAPDAAEVVYANKVMKNLPGGVVLFDGHLYGYSDSIGWVCQNWLTGDEVWSSKALDKGTLTVAGDKMICLTEDTGVVALAEASPEGWKEIRRFALAPQSERRAVKGKVWTPPVIANGRLYLRDQENLWCYQISLDAAPSKNPNSRQP